MSSDRAHEAPQLPPRSGADHDAPEDLRNARTRDERSHLHLQHLPDDRAAAAEAASNPIVPRIDGYDITGRLGEGGMGVVWRAVQHGTNRPVALKLMSAAAFGSERARLRFKREVDLTARLEHPHIARIYDGGESRGVYYFAMELVEGVPLDSHVAERKLSRPQILAVMKTVSEAVQYAHQKGVIHRDLKPSNILVAADGQPRVLDFGLAKATQAGEGEPAISIDGDVAGTPAFMSPEQAAGQLERLDTRSDVYTLGVILFHLLSGKYPHDVSGTSMRVMRRIAEEEPRRISTIEPGVDRDLEAILTKALAREPERRYSSAGGLAADLGRYLAGEPLEARPPTLTYLVSKKVRRHRVPLVVAAGVAAVLLGMAVWTYVRVSREKDAAVAANIEKEQQRLQAQANERRALEGEQQANVQGRAAELSRVEGLVRQAEALGLAGRWVESKALYEEAHAGFMRLGEATVATDAGLSSAYMRAPPPLLTLRGHEDRVRDLAVCPDGRRAVSAGEDQTVRVWDLPTGRTLHVLRGHTSRIWGLAVSPDGRRCLSAGMDKLVKLWDLETGAEIRTMTGNAEAVRCVAFAPGGDAAIGGSDDGSLLLWDLRTGHPIRTFPAAHGDDAVRAVAISPDGTRVLSGGGDHFVRLWDLATGKQLWAREREAGVLWVGFVPGGTRIMSAGDDKELIVSNLADGSDVQRFAAHSGGVRGAAATPDGLAALTCSTDRTLRLWDLTEDDPQLTLTGHTGPVNRVAVHPGGRLAVSASSDATLKVWDVSRETELIRLDKPGSRDRSAGGDSDDHVVLALAVSGDGRLVATIDAADRLKVWDRADGSLVRDFGPAGAGGERVELTFTHGGARVAVTDALRLVSWDLASGSKLATVDAPGTELGVSAFAPGGAHVLSGSQAGDLRLWDAATGKTLHALPGGTTVTSVTISADGAAALSGHVDGRLCLWDLRGKRLVHQLTGHSGIVWRAAFAPDGAVAVSAGFDQSVRVWDLVRGVERLRLPGHTAQVQAIDIAVGGTTIVSAAADYTLRLWDLRTGSELLTRRYARGPNALAVGGGDGLTVVSAWEDGAAEIWDLKRPAKYRAWDAWVEQAQRRLATDPADTAAIATLGEWYAFRGVHPWAVELLEEARRRGSRVSPLTLARSYRALGRPAEAKREFLRALDESVDAQEKIYLQLCINPAGDGSPSAASR